LPVAAGIPLLIAGLMIFNQAKQGHSRIVSSYGQLRER